MYGTMWKHVFLILTAILINLSQSEGQSYDDKRCKCICPSLSSVINTTLSSPDRLNFISNVPPSTCNCDGVIIPRLRELLKKDNQEPINNLQIFCLRCDCKYENRNTTIIKIVVIIVIWVISLLVIYMLFLMCLDPLLNKRIHKSTGSGYQEHTNEEDETSTTSGTSHPMGVRGNVLNRVGHQQDKWKRQVREQRRNIYDRHTMLN